MAPETAFPKTLSYGYMPGDRFPVEETPECDCERECGNASDEPIRYEDGEIIYKKADLDCPVFGLPWAQTREYVNKLIDNYIGNIGPSWFNAQDMSILQNGTVVCVLRGVQNSLWFDRNQSGDSFSARHGTKMTLKIEDNDYILFDPDSGITWRFFIGTGNNDPYRGKLKRIQTASGAIGILTYAISPRGIARITQFLATQNGTAIYYNYNYNDAIYWCPLASVIQRTLVQGVKVGSRSVFYTYYSTSYLEGWSGSLKTVKIYDGKDEMAPLISRTYYRYYGTDHLEMFAHALHYIIENCAWDKMGGRWT